MAFVLSRKGLHLTSSALTLDITALTNYHQGPAKQLVSHS